MSRAIDLRNTLSLRNTFDERSACFSAWSAILCFIFFRMGDRVRAIEVESLVEALVTKISRTDAFVRLRSGLWNYGSAKRDAVVAVCRREGIEAGR